VQFLPTEVQVHSRPGHVAVCLIDGPAQAAVRVVFDHEGFRRLLLAVVKAREQYGGGS
jgi:hypothetical protein